MKIPQLIKVCFLVAVLPVPVLISCGDSLRDEIEKDIEDEELSNIPQVTLSLLDPGATNNPVISLQVEESTNVTGWCLSPSDTPPEQSSGEWLSERPEAYTLTGGDGTWTIYAWVKTSAGKVNVPEMISVVLDREAPLIDSFTLTSGTPATDRNITFSLSGSDSVSGITGWLINEVVSSPDPSAGGWVTELPAAYQLSDGDGEKTVYAWARDGAGNVSDSSLVAVGLWTAEASVSLALTSSTPTSSPAITFNLGGSPDVTEWFISESGTTPEADDSGWLSTAPEDYSFSTSTQGTRTLYAWGKNAGNFVSSEAKSISIVLDTDAPDITVFTLTSAIPVISRDITFTLEGTDPDPGSGISSWLVNESASSPDPSTGGWVTAIPTGYQLSNGDGAKTVYGWAKDNAGNVSASASVAMTLYTSGPNIELTLTSAGTTSNPEIAFTLTGDSTTSGWYISESGDDPDPDGGGWTESAPVDYTFSPVPGTRNLYAWGKNGGKLLSSRGSLQIDLSVGSPSISIPSASVITAHEEIILTFSETMNNTSQTFGGGIGTAGGSWSTVSVTDDTLTISAATLWTAGSSLTLTADCTNQYDLPVATINLNYDVFLGTCVDDGAASGGDGSMKKPYDTIQEGIDGAAGLYAAAEVRVAEGTYSGTGPVVVMADAMSVLGCWSADFNTRGTDISTTIIRDSRTTGGSFGNPVATVLSDITYTQATELYGFTIQIPEVSGGSDCAGAGVRLNSSNEYLTLENLSITGQGGASHPDWSYGIYMSNCTQTEVLYSDIEPDDAMITTYGIFAISSTAIIYECQVHGGNAGLSGDGSSYGIYTTGNLRVEGVGPGSAAEVYAGTYGIISENKAYGIYTSSTGAPEIQYVTFTSADGDAYYLYEGSSTSSPAVFSNNYFGTSAGIWYTDNDLGTTVRYNTFSMPDHKVTVGGVQQLLSYWNNDGYLAE